MTDAPTAPTDTASLQAAELASSMAIFNESVAAHPAANDATAPEPVVTKTEPAKVAAVIEAKDKIASSGTTTDEFPDEVLSGKPAEPKPDPKKAEQEDDAILSERPQGQIKHDHFQKVQDAANRKVKAKDEIIEKFRADLEKLRTTAGKPSEEQQKALEQAQKDLARHRDRLALVDYQGTDEFKEKFTDPEASIRTRLLNKGKELGVESDLLERALLASGKFRDQILDQAELSGNAATAINTLLTQYDLLQDAKTAALGQSKERYAAHLQQQKAIEAQQMEQRKAIEKQTFEQARSNLAEKFPLFRPAQEGTKFQARQAEALAKAEAYFFNGSIPDIELAEVAYKASMFDEQNRWLDHVTKERNAFREKIAELTAANPGVNGNGHRPNLNDDMAGLTEEQRSMRIFEESRRAHGLG